MSAGLMCLRCRRYLDGDDACTCTAPIPSEDGKTPVGWTKPSRWKQAAENALARAIERYG